MKKNEKTKLLVALIITILVIAIRDLYINSLPFMAFSGITLISSLFLNSTGRAMYIISLLPFCRGIPYSEMILVVLLISLYYGIINKKTIEIKFFVPIVVIFILEICGYVYYNNFSNYIFYCVVYMIFVSYVISQRLLKDVAKEGILMYSISTIISIVLVVIREVISVGFDTIITYGMRFGANYENVSVTSYNANELGLYACVAVALLMVLNIKQKNKLSLIFSAIITFLGFLSISRTYIVTILLVWVAYMLFNGIKVYNIIILSSSVIIILYILSICYPEMAEYVFSFILERMNAEDIGSLSGRTDIAEFYLNNQFSDIWAMFFGFTQRYLHILHGAASHNGFHEIFICWGIIGTFVVIYWFYVLLSKCNENNVKINSVVINWCPVILFFIYIQTIQFFTQNCYLIVFLVSTLAFSLNNNVKIKY